MNAIVIRLEPIPCTHSASSSKSQSELMCKMLCSISWLLFYVGESPWCR